jgi:hypothetical protein
MRDYCAVLRSHEPGDPLEVEVLRLSNGQVVTGVINGPVLEVVASLTQSPPPTRTSTSMPEHMATVLIHNETTADRTVTFVGPVTRTFTVPAGGVGAVSIPSGLYEYRWSSPAAGTRTVTRRFQPGQNAIHLVEP